MFNVYMTRDTEIKNKLIVTRRKWGRANGGTIWEGLSRNTYKGQMDKAKGGRFKGGRQGWWGREEGMVG